MKVQHKAIKICNGKYHSARLDWNLELKKTIETSGAQSAKQLGNNWLKK